MSELDKAISEESVQMAKNLGERTLDQQANAIQEKGRAAIELIKVNLLVASLVLAILEFGTSSNQIPKASFVAVALGALAISIVLLVTARFTTSAMHWLNSDGLSRIKSDANTANLEAISDAYIAWAEENNKRMKKMDRLIVVSILLTAYSLGMMIGGVYIIAG